jgi:hypothetical protein
MTSKLIKEKQLKKYSKFESSTAVSQFSSISNLIPPYSPLRKTEQE